MEAKRKGHRKMQRTLKKRMGLRSQMTNPSLNLPKLIPWTSMILQHPALKKKSNISENIGLRSEATEDHLRINFFDDDGNIEQKVIKVTTENVNEK